MAQEIQKEVVVVVRDSKEVYEEYKNREFKMFKESDTKKNISLNTVEIFEYAQEHIEFCETKEGSLDLAVRMPDNSLTEIDLTLVPARVVHGNSLDGLGGQAKLADGTLAKRKFSASVASGPLFHSKIEEANKGKNREGVLQATGKFLTILCDLVVMYKFKNPGVHSQVYKDILARLKKSQEKEVLDDKARFDLALFRSMHSEFHRAFSFNSEDASKHLGVSGLLEFKITRSDFFPIKDLKKRRPVDTRVMNIYKAGEVLTNPSYKFAAEVVEADADKKEPKSFQPLNIVNVDPSIKYDVFGPYDIGRNSTVSFRVKPTLFYSGKFDGLNLYIESGIVLKSVPNSGGNAPMTTDYVVPKDEEAGDGEGGVGDSSLTDVEHKDKKFKKE